MHAQRLLILAGVVAIAIGFWLPWTGFGAPQRNLLDAELFRVPLVALALASAVLAFVGRRRERVTGPVLGTIVVAVLIIAGIAGLLAYSLATTGYGVGAGPFVTIGGALLVIIVGFAVGRPAPTNVGSVISSWKR